VFTWISQYISSLNILYFGQFNPLYHSHIPFLSPPIIQQLSVCTIMSSTCTDAMYFFFNLFWYHIIVVLRVYCDSYKYFYYISYLNSPPQSFYIQQITTWLGNLPRPALPGSSMLAVPLDIQGRHSVNMEKSEYSPYLIH
jgi:hypothetical protein